MDCGVGFTLEEILNNFHVSLQRRSQAEPLETYDNVIAVSSPQETPTNTTKSTTGKVDETSTQSGTEEAEEQKAWRERVLASGVRPEPPCQVVEVKAKEIVRSVVTEVESTVVPGPDAFEMVQLEDTDTEPEQGSPAILRRMAPTPSKIPKRIAVSPVKQPLSECSQERKPKRKSVEITVRKEIAMKQTLELVSSSIDNDNVFMESKVTSGKRRLCLDDEDSFNGSDKENDVAVEFSADEEEQRPPESDTSDDDCLMVRIPKN